MNKKRSNRPSRGHGSIEEDFVFEEVSMDDMPKVGSGRCPGRKMTEKKESRSTEEIWDDTEIVSEKEIDAMVAGSMNVQPKAKSGRKSRQKNARAHIASNPSVNPMQAKTVLVGGVKVANTRIHLSVEEEMKSRGIKKLPQGVSAADLAIPSYDSVVTSAERRPLDCALYREFQDGELSPLDEMMRRSQEKCAKNKKSARKEKDGSKGKAKADEKKSAKDEKCEKSAKCEKPSKCGKSVKEEKSAKDEKSGKQEKGCGKSGKQERAERSEMSVKGSRKEKKLRALHEAEAGVCSAMPVSVIPGTAVSSVPMQGVVYPQGVPFLPGQQLASQPMAGQAMPAYAGYPAGTMTPAAPVVPAMDPAVRAELLKQQEMLLGMIQQCHQTLATIQSQLLNPVQTVNPVSAMGTAMPMNPAFPAIPSMPAVPVQEAVSISDVSAEEGLEAEESRPESSSGKKSSRRERQRMKKERETEISADADVPKNASGEEKERSTEEFLAIWTADESETAELETKGKKVRKCSGNCKKCTEPFCLKRKEKAEKALEKAAEKARKAERAEDGSSEKDSVKDRQKDRKKEQKARREERFEDDGADRASRPQRESGISGRMDRIPDLVSEFPDEFVSFPDEIGPAVSEGSDAVNGSKKKAPKSLFSSEKNENELNSDTLGLPDPSEIADSQEITARKKKKSPKPAKENRDVKAEDTIKDERSSAGKNAKSASGSKSEKSVKAPKREERFRQLKESEFGKMGLSRELLFALDDAQYATPSRIQSVFIPAALTGEDVMGQAQTGTGKTAAFAIPILQMIEFDEDSFDPQALILVPTRELAVQVKDEFEKLAKYTDLECLALYGGKPLPPQVQQLKAGVDIIIGTPGRVMDHIKRGSLKLRNLKIAVLDEADRMLDIGFRPDIEKILRMAPQSRQSLLLSATIAPQVESIARKYMRDPEVLDCSQKDISSETIEQFYFTVDPELKFDLLLKLLEREDPKQAIIFCRTKRGVERVANRLGKAVQSVEAIHGDLQQRRRDRVMASFRAGKTRYLVATDVVGRGIDVSGISHIINYDIPKFCDDYVHRVGRTGRMGHEGVAFTFVAPEEGNELTRIEMRINQLLKRDEIQGFSGLPAMTANEPKNEEEVKEPPRRRRRL